MEHLFEDTVRKVKYLKDHGFKVVQKWECKLMEEMKHDEEMKRYFEEYELVEPLQPRDAFYGGRTNAAKLFHECQGNQKIRYELEKGSTRSRTPLLYSNTTFLQVRGFYKLIPVVQ